MRHYGDKWHNFKDTYNEGARGKEYVQNARFDREFFKSEGYKKLKDTYNVTTNQSFQKMLDAGITEYKDMNIILKKNSENPRRFTIDRCIGYSTLAKQCPNGVLYKDSKFIRFCQDRDIDVTPEEAEELRKVLIEFK